MNCPDGAGLSAFVDGEADGLEEHLTGCAACRATVESLSRLKARAGALPADIPPGRDLWPGIASRLDQETHGEPRPIRAVPARALAAGLALALLAAVVAVVTMSGGRPGAGPAIAGSGIMPSLQAAEERFDQASRELLVIMESRRKELAPETVEVVESSIALLDEAIEATRQALSEQPGSLEMARLLTGFHHKKIDLLRAAVHLPASV